jgi:hypothetical protein
MCEKMTNNEQFQAWHDLSEHSYKEYNDRRELEWKINVAVWTLLSAVGYLLVSQKIHLGCRLVPLFAMVPLHALWCIKIQRGEYREQQRADRYRIAAERILAGQGGAPGEEEPKPLPQQRFFDRFKSYWWWLFITVGMTSFVAAAVVTIAW